MPDRRRSTNESARWLVGAGIAVLAIATIVLVILALQSVRPATPSGQPAPAPTVSFPSDTPSDAASASPSPSPTPSSTPPTSGADAAWPRDAERMLALSDQGWWRATAGACDGPGPVVERSDDEGVTWEDVTPYYRDIAHVATLNAFAGSEAELVAAVGAACETQALRTFTQGEFWQPYADVLAASRYVDPDDAASVMTPAGPVSAPCADPRSFRAAGDLVALVCDGTASVLDDGGAWNALPAADDVALAIADDVVLTASIAADCEGLAVTRWSGVDLTTQDSLGCAVGADPAAPVALAAQGDSAVVWSGDALLTAG